MKTKEKKVRSTEEAKKTEKTEDQGVMLTEEQLAQVTGGDVTSAN